MTLSSEQLANLIVSKPVTQCVEAFVHGRQGHFRVRLPRLCTDSVHAVVGQHQMGQPPAREDRDPCRREPGCGADIAARAIHSFNQEGWITEARVVNQASAATRIDDSNTCVITLAIDAGTVVTETFDATTAFPAANAAKHLGTVANTHAYAGDVLTLAVTNGTTADPGPFLVEVDYV